MRTFMVAVTLALKFSLLLIILALTVLVVGGIVVLLLRGTGVPVEIGILQALSAGGLFVLSTVPHININK